MSSLKIILLHLFLMLTNINSQSNLEFSVLLGKSEYLIGEPIEIGLGIKNKNDSSITIAAGRSLKMEDKKGSELNQIKTVHGGEGKRILGPGEEVYQVVDLNTVYGTRYRGCTASVFNNIGSYKVIISYFSVERTIIFQKELEFNIIEPYGSESTAYNLFTEAIEQKSCYANSYADALEELINKYPNSVYVPKILVNLEAVYGGRLNLPEKAKEIRRNLIENYTFSGQAYYFLQSYIKNNIPQANSDNYLTNLKAKSTGSIMEKYIESLIKKYE